jgi:hypothetical protein
LTRATSPRRALTRIAAILAALATAIAATATPAAATAASAGGEPICFVVTRNGVPLRLKCVWVPIFTVDKPPRPCPLCSTLSFDFGNAILPTDEERLIGLIVDGLDLLVQAHTVSDKLAAAQLRGAALDRFGAAAGALGDRQPAVADVGYYDAGKDRFVSSPTPWLDAAGADIAAGLRLLRVGSIDPDGDPARQFDRAYAELSQRVPIDG